MCFNNSERIGLIIPSFSREKRKYNFKIHLHKINRLNLPFANKLIINKVKTRNFPHVVFIRRYIYLGRFRSTDYIPIRIQNEELRKR